MDFDKGDGIIILFRGQSSVFVELRALLGIFERKRYTQALFSYQMYEVAR